VINLLVQEFLNNWIKTYGKYNLKLTTRIEYERHINQYINPRIGLIELPNLKPIVVQNLYYELLESGRQRGDITKPLNAKTVLQTHRILHKAFKNAVQLELINSNPADSVELPKTKKYKYIIITGNELKQFLESFKPSIVYNAVYLAVLLGLRRGEMLALKFKDIDYQNKSIFIDKNLVYARGIVEIDTTKTEASERHIMLSDEILDFIKNIYESENCTPEDYIIRNLKGRQYRPGSFSRAYTWFRDSRNLKKVRFHDLRHIHATVLYQNGIRPKVIQERLGHSTIVTTMDIYTHLFKEDQSQAAQVISKIILFDDLIEENFYNDDLRNELLSEE